jgi:hypothetical protein
MNTGGRKIVEGERRVRTGTVRRIVDGRIGEELGVGGSEVSSERSMEWRSPRSRTIHTTEGERERAGGRRK